MASGNGVGSSKRKRGEGSGSGDGQEYPGDPPTADHAESDVLGVTEVGLAEDSTFSGVGVRVRVLAEIKNWVRSGPRDRKGREFLVDVSLPGEEDVQTRMVAAAIIIDLARLYWNPEHPVESLNILRVERWLRKPQVVKDEECIGKGLLDDYVQSHPVAPTPLEWKGLDMDKFKALKSEIVNRGQYFFKILKKKIAEVELRSRAGRQRQDEAIYLILPKVEENEPANLDSEDEIKRLEDQIACMKVAHAEQLRARDEQIAAFAKKKELDDAIIAVLQKFIANGELKFGPSFFGALEESLSDDDSIGYDKNGAQI